MPASPTLARRLWAAIEPLHAAVYFEPEPRQAATDVGLKGFWMGYFAGRVAPMGSVGPEAVGAVCFGFAPRMVHRAVPDAWSLATPATVLERRIEAVRTALARLLGPLGDGDDLARLDDGLWSAVEACVFDGRALAAAWRGVERPDDRLASLWLATTVLREHRGDGHVLAAVVHGLRGIDATTTHIATGAVTRELMMASRGWTDDEMDESVARLGDRGLLDGDGRLTPTGADLRHELEATTDRLAVAPIDRLGESEVDALIERARPRSRAVVDAGAFPQPNPIGLPRP